MMSVKVLLSAQLTYSSKSKTGIVCWSSVSKKTTPKKTPKHLMMGSFYFYDDWIAYLLFCYFLYELYWLNAITCTWLIPSSGFNGPELTPTPLRPLGSVTASHTSCILIRTMCFVPSPHPQVSSLTEPGDRSMQTSIRLCLGLNSGVRLSESTAVS